MADIPIFSPIELAIITDCTLQYHFWQHAPPAPPDPLEDLTLNALHHLHAAGGPRRLNLPATLRYLAELTPPAYQQDTVFMAHLRQMVAGYHRRLRAEWGQMMAGNETLTLTLKLRRSQVRCEATIDRLDKEGDGGIGVVQFITAVRPMPAGDLAEDIETTMLHALAAAAYPEKRPVRVKQLWLYHDQYRITELSEKAYRQNLARLKSRLQAWFDGEALARPGLYCADCPFQYHGCPIYQNEVPPAGSSA